MRQIDLSAPNPLSCKRDVRKIITRIACRFLRGIFVKSDRLLGVDFAQMGSVPHFRRLWSADSLGWRCANLMNPVAAHPAADRTTFLAPALLKGSCSASAELDGVSATASPSGPGTPFRLFIGMVPSAARRSALYFDIPYRLRPSPLNLIYRSLSGRITSIDPDAVFITFLDFDAY